MTQIASFLGQQVIKRLADFLEAVMATLTTTENLAMVNRECGRPGGFQMTILALISALNVIQWRWCCIYQSSATVATRTLPGRPVKHATDMAGSAVCRAVVALQGEPGCKVIKI